MIDKKKFNEFKKSIEIFDAERENVISISREIIKNSKHAIYSVHRNDMNNAKKLIGLAEKDISRIRAIFKKDIKLSLVGCFSDALQEYAEAKCFYEYVKNKKLLLSTDLGIDYEDYLLGLCDLTGELARRVVMLAIRKKYKEISTIRDLVDEIYGFFQTLDLRNSELRKKSDAIKWNLKKIEDVLYDVKMRQRHG